MPEGITRTTYDVAVEYIKRGWAVIPLHGIRAGTPGRCTCSKLDCGTPGKHPIEQGWTTGGRISTADCYSIWVETKPWANVGIVTGTVSGIFVLDIDPKNGGDEQLAELLAEYGSLPATYTVRTGSGGHHYYFQMPDFPITNKVKLAKYNGIDIRANKGQVVAPPSRSGIGPYDLESDLPIAVAPQWLLEILRAPANLSAADITVVEDLPSFDSLDPEVQRQCRQYARKVIDAECEAYAIAPSGRGNDRLFQAACNILEIIQSPWNLETADGPQGALTKLEQARQRRLALRGEAGGQTMAEFETTWNSARRKVVGVGRPLPPDPNEGLYFDVPFSVGSRVASEVAAASGAGPDVVTTDAVHVGGDGASLLALEAWTDRELRIARELDNLEIREEAKRRRENLAGDATTPTEDAVAAFMAKILRPADLKALPSPKYLIAGLLKLNSESWLISEPGGFKSFVAFDFAAHVSRGMDWRGQAVEQGGTLYVVAEGADGLKLRAEAWEQLYGPMSPDMCFYPEPVQVADKAAWAVLVEVCRRMKPSLVILDTQARITVGLEENSAKDIGLLVEAVRQVKVATGACVLVVHHVGRNGGAARGSSALDGAQDTELRVERPTDETRSQLTATISIDKQKDGDESLTFDIRLEVQDLGVDEKGLPITSLAIAPLDPFYEEPERTPEWVEKLTENQSIILETMRAHTDTSGVSKAELARLIKARAADGYGRDLPPTSLNTALNALKVRERENDAQGRSQGMVLLEIGASRYALGEMFDKKGKKR